MNKHEIKELVRKVRNISNSLESVFTKSHILLSAPRDVKTILSSIKNHKKTTIQIPVEIRSTQQPKSFRVELTSIFDDIKNGKYQSDQDLLERLLIENTLMPAIFFSNRNCYTPCGIFYHSAQRLDVRILNQLVLLVSKESSLSKEDMQLLKNDEHTFAFYRQIYPNRYFQLVRTTKMHSRNFVGFYDKIETYYSKLLDATKLTAMSLNIAIPFSYDKDLIYREHAKPF
jgi:hypothetical protein